MKKVTSAERENSAKSLMSGRFMWILNSHDFGLSRVEELSTWHAEVINVEPI
jgi:hypothetical protein